MQKVWCFFGVLLSVPHDDLDIAVKNECHHPAAVTPCPRGAAATVQQYGLVPACCCLSKAGENPSEERESKDNGIWWGGGEIMARIRTVTIQQTLTSSRHAKGRSASPSPRAGCGERGGRQERDGGVGSTAGTPWVQDHGRRKPSPRVPTGRRALRGRPACEARSSEGRGG